MLHGIPWKHYAKWNTTLNEKQKDKYFYSTCICGLPITGKFIEIGNRGYQGLEGGVIGGYCLIGTELFGIVKFWIWDDNYTTLWMYLMPLNYTLKWLNAKINDTYILPHTKIFGGYDNQTLKSPMIPASWGSYPV